ncbi:MAG: hypothetical protein HC879_22800 [Leptolyngbyaceae cyanobacterium SL_5_9]|nr:hypothetical protein [Leptolyngbyaceae cyanobacterium SM1_4_3]NJN60103.1 hypothetical protein [Leptolyngbyaceae cyanobacterium SL_5_9]
MPQVLGGDATGGISIGVQDSLKRLWLHGVSLSVGDFANLVNVSFVEYQCAQT